MCLIALAIDSHDDYALIVAANRDEFHERPTKDAAWWPDWPDIAGGRDLLAGGTWLAVSRDGRFGAVTNFRDAQARSGSLRSRGELVTGYLQGSRDALEYLHGIDGSKYDGFNLLVGDREGLAYLSNRGDGPRVLSRGIYGLSNAQLDSPCDKVRRSRTRLKKLIGESAVNDTELFRLLADREKGPLDEARSKDLPFATAHSTTAPFIVMPDFGTRCSTIFTLDREGRGHFCERRFDPDGKSVGETTLDFPAQ